MSDLTIMTFCSQTNKVPQKIIYNKTELVSGSVSPIHECITGKYDSIYLFLHNVSSNEIPVYVYQSDTPHTVRTLFKFVNVPAKGNHQILLFNGHTMFSGQKLYIVVEHASQTGNVIYTGYVKRFGI